MAAGIGNISIGFVADTTRFMVGSEKVSATLKAMGGPAGKLSGAFKALSSPLGMAGMALGAISTGTALAVAGFNRLMETAGELDRIGDTADDIGISAKALMKLEFAAEHSGSSAGQMDSALKKLMLTIGQARGGSKSAIAALNKVGVSVHDINNAAPDEVFAKIATGFRDVAAADKAVTAKGIFGKGGVDLIGTLNRGAEGLDKLAKKFDILGPKLDATDWSNIDDLDKYVKDADTAIKGLEQTMAGKLAPQMARWEQFKIGAATFAADNMGSGQGIINNVARFSGGAMSALPESKTFGGLGQFITLAPLFDYFADRGKKISDIAPATAEGMGKIAESTESLLQAWQGSAALEFGASAFTQAAKNDSVNSILEKADQQIELLRQIESNSRNGGDL